MGQNKSKDSADTEGTDNLPAEVAVNDIDILQRLAENGGPTAVSAYIDNNLNGWNKKQVAFAITGRSATGKSTFINTIRNVKPGDDGFAKTGSGNTTITPTLYMHPKNDQIAFYDLPGYSTTKFKKEDYISEMKISDYDFVFIFFNNVLSEDEIWLVGELRKLGKQFALVRSKIDLDIENAIPDGKDPEMIQQEIKESIQEAIKANPELKDPIDFFLISSRIPDLGKIWDLMKYVEENIDNAKAQTFLFSIGCISKEFVERKYKNLLKRLIAVTALSAGVASIPVEAVSGIYNAVLAYEVRHYMHVFEFEREIVNSLKGFEQSSLKCKELLGTHFDMMKFIIRERVVHYGVAPSLQDRLPFLDSYKCIIHSAYVALVTFNFLYSMLRDLKHDALLIHEHIVKTSM
jgi:GTP-binding protein EngB required for normal cell division